MASLFTRIIRQEIPCFKIAETEHCFSFLDIKPLAKGHTLVIPKLEIDYIFDVPDTVLFEMMSFSKRLAKAIQQVVPCSRIGVSVIGLEVPHAHIHLVPINSIADLNFNKQRVELSNDEFAALAQEISKAFTESL